MQNIEIQAAPAAVTQSRLGEKGFIAYIAFLSAFVPLSTDMYLPALPSMVDHLNATPAVVNLTIVLFFVFYAVGTLFWGPFSDKYGRKPVLLVGLSLYTLASFMCIFAGNVYLLIVYRVLQAIGCGSATAISNAIIKDAYTGEKRGRILAIVQSLTMASPIISPVIGAFLLGVTSWRGIFALLSVIALFSVIATFMMDETHHSLSEGNILLTLKKLPNVFRNKSLVYLLITFALIQIATMSFVTASSYIYVDGFGVSEKTFSLYFAANAIFYLVGPLLYIEIFKHINYRLLIRISYIIFALSGLMMVLIGRTGPLIFSLCLLPASLFGSIIGPVRMNLMIEQVTHDMGAASSVIMCTFTLFASIGMMLISSDFINRVLLLGILYCAMGIISLAAWVMVSKMPIIKHLD